MRYRLIICLICLLVAITKAADMGCLVGGSSSSAANAGWFRLDERTVADAHGTNGSARFSDIGVAIQNDGAGDVQFNASDDITADILGLWCVFTNSDGSEADGRYEIETVNAGADSFTINLSYIDGNAADYVIGGAVPIVDATYELQDVLDDALGSAAANNVDIYITGTGTLTATIDIDTGGGTAAYTKSIIGVNTSYVDDGTQATIYTETALANGLIEYWSTTPYIYTKNIYFDANGRGANSADHCVLQDDGLNGVVGCVFENCRFTDADDTGIHWGGVLGVTTPTYLILMHCEIDNADSHGWEGTHIARGMPWCFNTKIHDNGGNGVYIGAPGSIVDGCDIYDNGGDGINVGASAILGVNIRGNTLTRNDGDGIDFNALSHRAVMYNNAGIYNGGYSYKFNGAIPSFFSFNLGTTAGAETAITDAVADGSFAALFTGDNIASTQTEDALFETVTDGSEDHTPETGSDLIDAGIDVQDTPTTDIGAIQLDAAGVGAGEGWW